MIFPGSGTAFPNVCLNWIKEDWREETVPLSEEELRLLEQMERALVAEDPKFASALRGTTMRSNARRRSFVAGGVFLVGVVVLMTGAVMQQTIVGIVGFVVMLGSAYVALSSWRGQNSAPQSEEGRSVADSPENAFGLSVIEGGKAKKRSSRKRDSNGPSNQVVHGALRRALAPPSRRQRLLSSNIQNPRAGRPARDLSQNPRTRPSSGRRRGFFHASGRPTEKLRSRR